MLLSFLKPGLSTIQDLDEEDGSLYWNFQEFCVLKFRKGVEDHGVRKGSSRRPAIALSVRRCQKW